MAIPNPEPGLVISYAYLWHHEHQAGKIEGRKIRPSVIVLTVTRQTDETTTVIVLPITHIAPDDPGSAIEIPQPIKKHLGLDADRSWVVITEGNEFLWPGYDLRKVPKSDRYEYGFLPPRFFGQVLEAFAAHYRAGLRRLVDRE
jgi:hypothetical protein